MRAGFDKLYLGVGVESPGARQLYQRLSLTFAGQTATRTYRYVENDRRKQVGH